MNRHVEGNFEDIALLLAPAVNRSLSKFDPFAPSHHLLWAVVMLCLIGTMAVEVSQYCHANEHGTQQT